MHARRSSRALLFLLAISAVLLVVLARPFALTLVVAAVFATALSPLQEKLTRAFGGRRTPAAVVVTVGFALAGLLPLVALVASVAQDVADLGRALSRAFESDGVGGLVERAPAFLRGPLHSLLGSAQLEGMSLDEQFRALGGRAATVAASLLGGAGSFALKTGMMIVALATFLIEGPSIARWLEDTLPLERAQTDEILDTLRRSSNSIVVANIGTAAVQTVVALAGYLIAGAPSAILATFVTFLCALGPGIGAASVTFLVALLMMLSGERTGMAIFLGIWAVVVVSVVDNVVRPLFMRRGADMHAVLLFFAVISGLVAFGASGFIVGPLIVSFALCVLRLWKQAPESRDNS